MHRLFSGFSLFSRAYQVTRREIWVSVRILILVTCCFALAMYLAEHSHNADYSLWDAFVWTFVKYVEDPADIVDPPATIFGKIVGTLVGVLGIAIFAVPAGLIGTGLMEAMTDEQRETELKAFRRRMQKAFRRKADPSFRQHLGTLPDGGGEQLRVVNVVPQRVKVARMQVRQGMDLKDIIDTCREFPEFRLKNLAEARAEEDDAADRFVVEHFPLNRSYGCCINRQSRVTIVCTSSFDELGSGWFTYYMAKFGGFNYISKEVEVDTDELDSFYNLSPEPLYDKRPASAYTAHDKEALRILGEKQRRRDDFLHDVRAAVGSGSWVIIVTTHLKNSMNTFDFHLADSLKDASTSTISDRAAYDELCQQFAATIQLRFGLSTVSPSPRYPLMKKNLGFRIREMQPDANSFVIRPSTDLVNFNPQNLAIAYEMAQVIGRLFAPGCGMTEADAQDLRQTGFGYGGMDN